MSYTIENATKTDLYRLRALLDEQLETMTNEDRFSCNNPISSDLISK